MKVNLSVFCKSARSSQQWGKGWG